MSELKPPHALSAATKRYCQAIVGGMTLLTRALCREYPSDPPVTNIAAGLAAAVEVVGSDVDDRIPVLVAYALVAARPDLCKMEFVDRPNPNKEPEAV